jgi:hypothetical protein
MTIDLEPPWNAGPECEFCGCSEFDACPGGCAWSEYFLDRGRAVCTTCEAIAICLEINLGALDCYLLSSNPEVA